jgi:four helix bundle protein
MTPPTNKNTVREKSFAFAIRAVKLGQFLQTNDKEYVLSKQILRSGTAIGALIREAEHAESRIDFIHKMSIALKEASETEYWTELLYQTDYLNQRWYESVMTDVQELNRLLITIIKTAKRNAGIASRS